MDFMTDPKQSSARLLSLDVFRGATIAAMMLVNNPGDWSNVYAPFLHAKWHGWTFTDLVFPFFLWIVGVAMTLSFAKRIERGDDKGKLLLHVIRRSVIIFALGLFLAGFPYFNFSTIRIPGVLQRIAVCYLISSIIFLWTSIRGQALWIGGLLTVYWLLVKLIPVPGYGAGILDLEGNLCWHVDSTVLAGHTWRGAPLAGFDPEGIVSTLPAIATTLFGIMTGHMLRMKKSEDEKTVWMFLVANGLLFAGVVMDNWLPINKNLWTSSYAVFMAGMALNVFALCYWILDVKGISKWSKPLAIYGMNAIAVFVLAGVVGRLLVMIPVGTTPEGKDVMLKTFMYETLFVPLASPMNASLLYALAFVLFLYAVAYVMYRFKWFLKV
jgi:predicted acyltransferase